MQRGIIRALYTNIIRGERVSGASTITMQVARMLSPAERTYWSKLVEVFRAIQLEMHYSKDEILELYLSMLPYGGNIEGVKSASYLYFNRPPINLSLSQSVMLAVIPNDPNKLRLDTNPDAANEERIYWLRKFDSKGVFPHETIIDFGSQ